jgi:SCY1-like protein 1
MALISIPPTAKLTFPQEDGSKCSIFSFDITANKSRLPLARNALRKLRTLRHPGVVKVLDTQEVGAHSTFSTMHS